MVIPSIIIEGAVTPSKTVVGTLIFREIRNAVMFNQSILAILVVGDKIQSLFEFCLSRDKYKVPTAQTILKYAFIMPVPNFKL
jgi:hypothetical protein